MNEPIYIEQVKLMLEVLPYALSDHRFALKGGTAINMFYRNMPRLSVDIDLVYLPLEDRQTTFNEIHNYLKALKETIEREFKLTVQSTKPLDGKSETKIVIHSDLANIKIEPNFTMRGTFFPPAQKEVSKIVQEQFDVELELNCVSFEDLYGGKICAALDRQHPRDLFDVKELLENEGITDSLTKSFVGYLVSHNRPIHELLSPNLLNINKIYQTEFKGMVRKETSLDALIETRKSLISRINSALTSDAKLFLSSFFDNDPKWELSGLQNLDSFPAVKWKLMNQAKMDKQKRYTQKILLDTILNA
jgi:predicted nucleotidyltransferase component of viral defense system